MAPPTTPEPPIAERPDALVDLLTLARGDNLDRSHRSGPNPVEGLALSGPRIVLPSSFAVTAGAVAAVGAFSLLVAELSALRRTESRLAAGRSSIPIVRVDSIEACMAFQSERHLELERPGTLWEELSGHYRTADGHIQFHTNFPHHRRAVLEAIGCGPEATRQTVEAVVADRGRFDLERAVGDAGGIAAALRSIEEWAEHPHAAHVKGRPPLRLFPTPGRPGRPAGSLRPAPSDRPLAGVRVLDLTRVIAGPVASRALAAYGADVLRIGADHLPVVESLLPDTTLGKRFAHCDLTTPEGRTVLLGLASEADVILNGYRPGALEARGLAEADFLNANPELIIASLSAFGTDGPWGGRRGFDSITQTATGIVAAETEAFSSAEPRPLPCQFLDHATGYLLALGIVSALTDRHRGLGARSVEASLLTTRNWLVGIPLRLPSAPTATQPMPTTTEPTLITRDTPYGRIGHVGQPGRIDGVPAHWERGPSRPGADRAVWLPQGANRY
jgi:crotonobetainyl-CoA:carnitine CoA-transferase CaiB-like acyl-CoA transferase